MSTFLHPDSEIDNFKNPNTLRNYNFQCNKYKIITDGWLCGPAEKDFRGQKFDGAFPAGFLKNWRLAFKKYIPTNTDKILHVCAGRTPKTEGKTLDIEPKYHPDFLCNAENMVYGDIHGQKIVPGNEFEWAIADPPYNEEAARKYYHKKLLNKAKMLKEMMRVVSVNGFVGILDQTMPQRPPSNLKCIARIGVTSVPNLDMRIFTVFRKMF